MLYSLFFYYIPTNHHRHSFIHRKDESNQSINQSSDSITNIFQPLTPINQSVSQSMKNNNIFFTILNKGNTRGTTRIMNRILPFLRYTHTQTHTYPLPLPTILSYLSITIQHTHAHTNNFILFFPSFIKNILYSHTHTCPLLNTAVRHRMHYFSKPIFDNHFFLNLEINNKDNITKPIIGALTCKCYRKS
jgi:hypothetical protein